MENKETIENVKTRLAHSFEHFSYKKVDGTVREAFGTTCEEYIKDYGGELPKGTGTERHNDDIVRYYDVESKGWRSFRFENFIEFISEEETDK